MFFIAFPLSASANPQEWLSLLAGSAPVSVGASRGPAPPSAAPRQGVPSMSAPVAHVAPRALTTQELLTLAPIGDHHKKKLQFLYFIASALY